MDNWKEGHLSEIAEIVMGQSPSGSTCNTNGEGTPLLNGPTEFTNRYPLPVQYTTDVRKESQINDILFCVRGSTTGRMNWSDRQYAIGRGLAAIRHIEGVEYKNFVKGILDYNLEYLLLSATGSTFPNVSKNHLHKLEIFIPPLPEQKAIAEVLTSLDDKMDLLHRQNKTLEAMAEMLFRQWFVEEADESWEEVKLGRFISTNVKSVDKKYNHSNIQYLDTGSLNEGNWGPLQHFELSVAPSRAKRLTKHNDILYSTVRPDQLHYGLVRNRSPNLVVSTGFCVIQCDNISNYFVYYLLIEKGMVQYLHSIAEGSTSAYPSLKPSDLEAIEFLLPTESVLTNFHKMVDSYWNRIDYNYIQIQTLTNLRDTLLPKLMSGEVRVKMN